MEKQVKCPWCGELMTPVVSVSPRQYGDVKERKCPKCNAVIAAYLDEPGVILEKVRIFQG
jgi:ribosomal protein S27AE